MFSVAELRRPEKGLGASRRTRSSLIFVQRAPSPKPLRRERSERREHLDVVRFVSRVVEDFLVADNAVLVDHEHRALGDPLQADHVLVEHAEFLDRLLVEVAQQRKVVPLRILEGLEGEEGVDADAVDLRLRRVQPCHRVAERAQLLCAHAAERGRKKCQHNRLALLFAEFHRVPVLVGQGEVRRFRSNVYRHNPPSTQFTRVCGNIFGFTYRRSSVIEVQHLTKRYGRITAVDDVSFRVERGEILGFLGPNGAGKTTTMRILTGYMPATEGKAIVAGFDVFEQAVEAKRRTGYLPETPPLYPDMSVAEYLDFVARIKGVPGGERRQRINDVMEKTKVADMRNRLTGKLSKGYKQRVGLAQALIHNPDVLILDEPTAGLDPKQIIETRGLIKQLAGDHTIILSTHILPEVSQTCQRVVIINQGHVVAVDTPDNLTARLRGSETMYLQLDASGADAAAPLTRVPGVTRRIEADRRDGMIGFEGDSEQGRDIRRDLARAIVASGWGLLELRPTRMSLEEVFLSLTTEDVQAVAAAEPVPEGATVP